MSVEPDAEAQRLLDRLRTNLSAAGISLDDLDVEGMAAAGFLHTVLAFEQIAAGTPSDVLPDYLGAWGDDGSATETTASVESTLPADFPRPSATTARYPMLLEMARRLQRQEITPPQLVDKALARIRHREPELNAFQAVFEEEAMEASYQAEREIAAGDYRGPLHGIPIAVKDLFAMTGTTTTAGSKILADWVPDFDATVVERLRAAGAIIVGKTRMSEFAYSPGSNNAHYGETHNPWNLEHDTGGSSSGSGAAVADGMVFGALGSDTGGSIRMPAALCGIVGLKPTFGRISLHGAVPLSWSLDHAGPMTRTVADAAAMLQVLAGPDPRDSRTRSVPVPDYLAGLGDGVEGLRIGVLREDGYGEGLGTDEAVAAWQAGLATLEQHGAQLIELDLPRFRDLGTLNSAIIAMEAATYHQPMLRERLDDYGDFMRRRILSAYGYGPTAMVQAQQARALIRREFDAIFEQVDLLSTPSMLYGAPPLGQPSKNTRFTAAFNALGWPAITVPVGRTTNRLPLGLQLAGRPWDEATVLRAAAVVEVEGPWEGGVP